MNSKIFMVWFSIVSVILIIVGIIFAFLDLAILPLSPETTLRWVSAIYGAIMMGWGTTLLLVGRIALRRKDFELIKALLYGLVVWLVVEALFSAYLGVWFNVGVDTAVLLLFSLPMLLTMRLLKREK